MFRQIRSLDSKLLNEKCIQFTENNFDLKKGCSCCCRGFNTRSSKSVSDRFRVSEFELRVRRLKSFRLVSSGTRAARIDCAANKNKSIAIAELPVHGNIKPNALRESVLSASLERSGGKPSNSEDPSNSIQEIRNLKIFSSASTGN